MNLFVPSIKARFLDPQQQKTKTITKYHLSLTIQLGFCENNNNNNNKQQKQKTQHHLEKQQQ